jgi:hypothetical protein
MQSMRIIREENVTCMGEIKGVYKVLVRKSEETTQENRGIDGRIKLEMILRK